MQDMMPPPAAGAQIIQSYGAGSFRISNQQYTTAVLVLPTRTMEWKGELSEEMLAQLAAEKPPIELLLIGTGARHAQLPSAWRQTLRAQGIASDSMDTGAACRTYNVLLAEGRAVAAALVLPA